MAKARENGNRYGRYSHPTYRHGRGTTKRKGDRTMTTETDNELRAKYLEAENRIRLACTEAGKDYNLWQAVEIWRTNGHSENVMIYILTDLLATIEQLRKG